MSRPAPATRQASAAAAPITIDRLVVQATGDASAGQRIAERLPGSLERALAGARALDERSLRSLIDRATREAAR